MDARRDPLVPFDAAVIGAVAAERGFDGSTLHERVRDHQAAVRELPGVEDLVYEWRRAFPRNLLVERRTEAYYLRVPTHVRPEFGDTCRSRRRTWPRWGGSRETAPGDRPRCAGRRRPRGDGADAGIDRSRASRGATRARRTRRRVTAPTVVR